MTVPASDLWAEIRDLKKELEELRRENERLKALLAANNLDATPPPIDGARP